MQFQSGAADEDADLSEINVTPFIDVMLVLLIVFMVAAPLSTVAVSVQLPASSASANQPPPKPMVVSLTADRQLLLHETPVEPETLQAALDEESNGDRSQPVQVLADATVNYADLMHVLDALQAAGYLHIALVGVERLEGP